MSSHSAPKSPHELLRQVQEQFDLLIHASQRFDEGRVVEVMPLATTLRVLLHDAASSKSALGQTGHKATLQFLDTAGDIANGLLVNMPAMATLATAGVYRDHYCPRLDAWERWAVPFSDLYERMPGDFRLFDEWWGQVVLADTHGNELTRSDAVRLVANQEGGAHIDPVSDPRYEAIVRSNSFGWQSSSSPVGPLVDTDHAVAATIRQIAWEVHATALQGAPELLPERLRTVPLGTFYERPWSEVRADWDAQDGERDGRRAKGALRRWSRLLLRSRRT